jgi:hypothetical protein
MFKFFKKKKITINLISIPNFNWEIVEDNKSVKQWINPEQTISLSLNFFDLKPNLPLTNNIDELRVFYRNQIVSYNGGLVEVEVLDLKGFYAIKTIFKIPQEPTGMVYLASFTIPFEECSFVFKIQAPEIGITGMRDSVIVEKLLSEEKISFGDEGLEGWFNDPYDSELKEGTLMNKSEEGIYDELFPEHPLTLARALLQRIESEISFDKELGKIKKFNN